MFLSLPSHIWLFPGAEADELIEMLADQEEEEEDNDDDDEAKAEAGNKRQVHQGPGGVSQPQIGSKEKGNGMNHKRVAEDMAANASESKQPRLDSSSGMT